MLRPDGEPDRDGHTADPGEADRSDVGLHPLGDPHGVVAAATLHHDRQLLTTESTNDVVGANDRARRISKEGAEATRRRRRGRGRR